MQVQITVNSVVVWEGDLEKMGRIEVGAIVDGKETETGCAFESEDYEEK